MIPQKDKIMLGVKIFSRKSSLVPGFTTIRKCTPGCDDIVALHTDGKGVARENWFRVDPRRQLKCDVLTARKTLHPQHLQT